jgi:uracil-DNA glycosylase family 4
MNERQPVLSHLNGNLDSHVIFVAEAPGRLGADKFRIPLYGDQTGRNFDYLISCAGIKRDSIFITNAILCNPRDIEGNNSSPTITEIRNCSYYLNEIIGIIKPKYVVTLGKVAITAINLISPLNINLKQDVGKLFSWNDYQIIPLFHPGPRAFIWRSKSLQITDYANVGKLLK